MPHTPIHAISPRLRHRLKEVESLLARDGDAIMVCEAGDLDPPFPRIVDANAALARLTGHDIEAMLGQTPRLFRHPDADPASRAAVREALTAKQRLHIDLLNRSKSGEDYWVETDIAPVVDPDSGRLFYIAFQRDVTRRKRLEDELKAALARAERATEGRNEFLAAVANDLRGPLGVISANLELLGKGLLSPGQHPLVVAAETAARSLAAQIGDMIEFARLDAAPAPSGPAVPLILSDFVLAMRRGIAVEAAHRRLHVETMIGPGVPEVTRTDIPRLRQLVGHLLAHALRQTESGGIALVVERAGADIRFSVHDSGPGGKAAHGEWQQAGVGPQAIGLAIAAHLAAVLQSWIEMDTAPGTGTSLWFDLPAGDGQILDSAPTAPIEWRRALRAGARGNEAPPPPEAEQDSPLSALRVLVIEEDPARRTTLARQIHSLGAKVDILADRRMALIVATAETRYDAVILRDEGSDAALDFARALRDSEAEHGLPHGRIVLLCDAADEARLRLCREAGIDALLEAPFDLSSLADALSEGAESLTQERLEAIDAAALKARLNIADDFELAAALAVFAEELDDIQQRLEQAVAVKDGESARDLLHMLAGKARDNCAPGLAAALPPCQTAVAAGDWGFATRALSRIGTEADRLRDALEQMLTAA
ncbi:PAS domain S-box protein [Zavarzinia compransoris]|uniref:PAS domain-containing sensor histidine kinase n=1 Tax=Zavarzinia marina TaxID=2911065 RepID=UPI001F25824E|nr:PAS domain S-box protein [Zavarzinia marina]MCF4165543.1 PAS domain S-box protein [Zavarzinia marina]